MIGSRPVLIFLAKAIVLFVGFTWLWGGDRPGWYHTIVAGALDNLLPVFDPTGMVEGVRATGKDVLVRLGLDGQFVVLSVNLSDISNNMGLLWTLYLASFDWRQPRTGAAIAGSHLAGSVAFLFVVHLVTAATFTFEALMTHPLVMRGQPFSNAELSLIPRYDIFYEELGSYLVVLLLWLPYAMLVIREGRAGKGQQASDRELAWRNKPDGGG